MGMPVKPSQLLALVTKPEDSKAVRLIKTFGKLPILLYKIRRWEYSDDGSFSQEHADMHCKIECPTAETSTTTT